MPGVVVGPEVIEVAQLHLETGSRHPWASPQPIAVLAPGRSEVHLEPGFGQLDPLLPVAFDQKKGGPVGFFRVALLKRIQENLGWI